MNEPIICFWPRKNGMMSNGTTSPEWPPQMTRRPSLASESSPFWKSSPPTCSKTRSTPRPSVARITSATTSCVAWLIPTSMPSSVARASFSSEPAFPITNAPASLASCTAAEPIPLPTELISTVSPGPSRPRVKSMCQAVPKAIWVAAAASSHRLVRDADEVPGRAGELLRVAAGGREADEPGLRGRATRGPSGSRRTRRRSPSGTASPARRPPSRSRPRRVR